MVFVPATLTDAINNAVYDGWHTDAAGMLGIFGLGRQL